MDGVGSASASFGGRFEHAIKAFRTSGRNARHSGGLRLLLMVGRHGPCTYSWKYIPIGVTANCSLHKISELEVGPLRGLGLGYQYIDAATRPGLGSG